ncbi:hypothetical protein ABG902_06685 [Bifidobacterium longum]
MSTLNILGNTSEQADSIRLMLKVRGMKDGRFIDADPLIILKADNHQGSDRWDVYVSKTVYPTAESYGAREGNGRRTMSDCYLCRKPLHGDSSSVDIKRWDPRRNVFFDETRRACAECVRRRNGYQSRRAKARRDAARVLLNKWLDKQMEVDDELA